MARIISDSLIFAGPTSEQVLSSPVHRAQQLSPADYSMLYKNLKGQDFNSAIYPTTSLQHTLGAAHAGLWLTPLELIGYQNGAEERCEDGQCLCWVLGPELGGLLLGMRNYHKEIQQKQLLVKLSSLNQFFSLRLVQGRQRKLCNGAEKKQNFSRTSPALSWNHTWSSKEQCHSIGQVIVNKTPTPPPYNRSLTNTASHQLSHGNSPQAPSVQGKWKVQTEGHGFGGKVI